VTVPAPGAEATARLGSLARRLEEAAVRLRADGLDPEEAKRLAGECAEIAADAAIELDRLARGGARGEGGEAVPGQEELL
jgi:hypothetical protein